MRTKVLEVRINRKNTTQVFGVNKFNGDDACDEFHRRCASRLSSEWPAAERFRQSPQSPSLSRNSALPLLIPGTRAHVGLLVALAFIPALLALDRSLIGYRLRLFSINPTLAKRASVDPKAYITWLITFGGAGAGLAGWMQVAAIDHRLYPTVASPIDYAGLFVALLGALHPLGSVVAAFFLDALRAALQVGAGVSPEIIQVFLGLILFIYASRPRATR